MRKLIIPLIILLILTSGCIQAEQAKTCEDAIAELPQLIADAQDYPTAQVQRVVDGDTVIFTDGERVRLIGIDTPERGEEYFSEATQHLQTLVTNKTLYLERDISKRDKYNRLLYYFYTENKFVNAEMVSSGYARSYPYEPDTYHSFLFDCLEEQAKEQKLVIWSKT